MSTVEACAAFIPRSLQLFEYRKEMKVCSVAQALMHVIDTPENSFGPWVWLLTCIRVLPHDFWLTHSMHIVFVVRYGSTELPAVTHQQWNAIIFSFSPYLDVTPHQGYMTLGIKYYWAKTDHWQRRLSATSSNIWKLQFIKWPNGGGWRERSGHFVQGQRNWCPRHNEASVISGASNCQQKGYTAKYVTSYIHCSKVLPLGVFHQVQYWKENFLNGEE